jgi:hypothetical protein
MTYPQETKEFQPIRVRVDGVEVLTGVKVAVIAPGTRPVTWVDPVLIQADRLAVMVEDLAPGTWNVWAQVTTVDEVAVVYCGNFKVTA